MNRAVDALELLTSQHDEIEALLMRLPTVDGERRALALGALADKLCTHLAAEQELLYPYFAASTRALGSHEPADEDELVKLALANLLALDLDSDELAARLSALHDLLESHSRWQEDQLFVELAETVPPEMLSGLGAQLLEWSEGSLCIAA
jgi:hypothetical protein